MNDDDLQKGLYSSDPNERQRILQKIFSTNLILKKSDPSTLMNTFKSCLLNGISDDAIIVKILDQVYGQSPTSKDLHETFISELLPCLLMKMGETKAYDKKPIVELIAIFGLKNEEEVGERIVSSILKYGVEAEDWRIRRGTIESLPEILKNWKKTLMLAPVAERIIPTIIARLRDVSDLVIQASVVTLGKLVVLFGGPEIFQSVCSKVLVSPLQQQLLKTFWPKILENSGNNLSDSGNNVRSRTFTNKSNQKSVLTKSEDLWFGFIPDSLYRVLSDSSTVDLKIRSGAIEQVSKLVTVVDDASLLTNHVNEILNFFIPMLDDPNFKITLMILRILSDVTFKIGIAIKPHLNTLVPALFNRYKDTKLLLRQTIAKILNHLMNVLSPKPMVNLALHQLDHENAKVREEIINCLISAMLLFPNQSEYFDWQSMILGLLGGPLKDIRSRVRFVAMEALALISTRIGNSALLEMVRQLDTDEATVNLIIMRIESFPLAVPFLNNDGLVEHVGSRSHSVTSRPNSSTLSVSDEINAAVALRTGSAPQSNTVTITTLHLNTGNTTSTLNPPQSSSRRSTYKPVLSAPPAKAVGVFHGSPVKNSGAGHPPTPTTKSWLTNSEPGSLNDSHKDSNHEQKLSDPNVAKKDITSFRQFLLPLQDENRGEGSHPSTPRNDLRKSPGGMASVAKAPSSKVKRAALATTQIVAPTTVSMPASLSPLEEYKLSLQQLKGNPDWQAKCQCMESIKLVYPQITLNQQDMHALVFAILDEVSNLRSSVSRLAISTLIDICEASKRMFDSELDNVTNVLMKKAGDGNQFIHEVIDECLLAMCRNCTLPKLLSSLLHHIDSKNQLARQKVSICFSSLVEKNFVWNSDLEKIIVMGLVPLAFDSAVDTRQISRRALVQLAHRYQPEFYRVIEKSFTAIRANEIKEAIESFIKRGSSSVPANSKKRGNTAPKSVNNANNPFNASAEEDTFQKILQDLKSNDWKTRFTAIQALSSLVIDSPRLFNDQNNVTSSVDVFIDRLQDGNVKVQQLAVNTLNEIIPVIKGNLDVVLVPLITALSNCLSSSNIGIKSSAQNSVDLLFQYAEPQIFIPALVNTIQYSNNSRVKPILLDKLITYIPGVRKNLALKYVAPLVNKLSNDSKTELRLAAQTLQQRLNA